MGQNHLRRRMVEVGKLECLSPTFKLSRINRPLPQVVLTYRPNPIISKVKVKRFNKNKNRRFKKRFLNRRFLFVFFDALRTGDKIQIAHIFNDG